MVANGVIARPWEAYKEIVPNFRTRMPKKIHNEKVFSAVFDKVVMHYVDSNEDVEIDRGGARIFSNTVRQHAINVLLEDYLTASGNDFGDVQIDFRDELSFFGYDLRWGEQNYSAALKEHQDNIISHGIEGEVGWFVTKQSL